MARHKKPKTTRGRRGDGTVFPVKNKAGAILRYACDVELLRSPGGTRNRIRVYGATEAEAHEKRRQLLVQRDQGTVQTPDATTFQVYAEWFLDTVKAKQVSAQTLENYRGLLTKHCYPAFGSAQLRRITTERIQTMFAKMTSVAPSIVDDAAMLLNQVFTYAVKARPQRLKENPMDGVLVPRYTPPGPRALTEDELRRFIVAITGHEYEGAWWLAICGLRAGEVCGAQWGDIDWDAGCIHVQRQAVRTKASLSLTDTLKSQKSRRTVYLLPQALTGLRAQYTRDMEAQLKSGRRSPQIVTPPRTPVMDPATLWRHFKRLLVAAKLPREEIALHDLRHTYATLAARAGAAPKDVQAQLGHSTLAMTLGVYTDSTEAGQRAASERLSNLLG